MEHDAPIFVQLDQEPQEDTVVEPPADLVALLAKKKEETKVTMPATSDVPQGMKAVIGKRIIVNRNNGNKKKKKETSPESPVKYPFHLLREDLNNLGIEELRKKFVIQEIKRSVSQTLFYEHAINLFGPIKAFLAAMPKEFLPDGGEGDHDYSAKDYAATNVEPPNKKSKSSKSTANLVPETIDLIPETQEQ